MHMCLFLRNLQGSYCVHVAFFRGGNVLMLSIFRGGNVLIADLGMLQIKSELQPKGVTIEVGNIPTFRG